MGRISPSSCSIVDLRNCGAVSRMKSFQNCPGSSSTSGFGLSRISASSNPCASSVPANDSSTTKTTRAPRSRSTRPIPTQLFVGPYAPSGKNAIVGPATARGLYVKVRMWKSSTSRPFAVRRASLAIPSRSSKRRRSSSPASSAASSCSSRKRRDDVCSPATKRSSASTLLARPNSWPSWSASSQLWRGATQSSIVAAKTVSASSTSTSTGVSGRSAGVGRGRTSSVGMAARFPGRREAKRERRAAEARRLRAGRGARRGALGALRGRSRPDRRLRALLVVRRGDRHLPRRGRRLADDRRGRPRGARAGAPARDGLPGLAPRRGDHGSPPRSPVRGAGLRRLRAPVKAKLSTDGGARGNPGPAAYGYVLEAEDGTVLDARGEAIGVATNNVAEYRALVAGLAKAAELGLDEVEVVSDSELLVKQMRGEYKVKNAALRELNAEAEALARRLPKVTYTAVRRELNELADRLVNEALDAISG